MGLKGWPMGTRAKAIDIAPTFEAWGLVYATDSFMLQLRGVPTWVRHIRFGVERWLVDP